MLRTCSWRRVKLLRMLFWRIIIGVRFLLLALMSLRIGHHRLRNVRLVILARVELFIIVLNARCLLVRKWLRIPEEKSINYGEFDRLFNLFFLYRHIVV